MNNHNPLTMLVQRVFERVEHKAYEQVSTLTDNQLIAIIRRETGINGEMLMQIAGLTPDGC